MVGAGSIEGVHEITGTQQRHSRPLTTECKLSNLPLSVPRLPATAAIVDGILLCFGPDCLFDDSHYE